MLSTSQENMLLIRGDRNLCLVKERVFESKVATNSLGRNARQGAMLIRWSSSVFSSTCNSEIDFKAT